MTHHNKHFKINDVNIKKDILEYQQTYQTKTLQNQQEHETKLQAIYKKIMYLTSNYIYNYPLIISPINHDQCGEFFLYFMERFPKILIKYQIQEVLFQSWLTVVLKSHYLNWIKIKKKCPPPIILAPKHFDTLSSGFHEKNTQTRGILENHNDTQPIFSSTHNVSISRQQLLNIFNKMSSKLSLVAKLYFFDFFSPKDLLLIAQTFQQNKHTLFAKYQKTSEIHYKIQQNKRCALEKIQAIYYKIQQSQAQLHQLKSQSKDMLNIPGSNEQISCKEIEKRLERLQTQHRKSIEAFQTFQETLKTQDIANFLDASIQKTYSLLYRMKIELKKKLNEHIKQNITQKTQKDV